MNELIHFRQWFNTYSTVVNGWSCNLHCRSFGHTWLHCIVNNPLYHCRHSVRDGQYECNHSI